MFELQVRESYWSALLDFAVSLNYSNNHWLQVILIYRVCVINLRYPRHAPLIYIPSCVGRRSDKAKWWAGPGEVRLSFRKPYFRSRHRTAFPDEQHWLNPITIFKGACLGQKSFENFETFRTMRRHKRIFSKSCISAIFSMSYPHGRPFRASLANTIWYNPDYCQIMRHNLARNL
jgi:hypothetical protein